MRKKLELNRRSTIMLKISEEGEQLNSKRSKNKEGDEELAVFDSVEKKNAEKEKKDKRRKPALLARETP
jgi:bifunctional DNA-binding transcriptional regulator/antitoxin component of YhaV-PrlF toxin-antitoxin module